MQKELEELGLTHLEAKVYLSLLTLGATRSGLLVKKTQLHRATVYDLLKRLQEKGLVTYVLKEKTKIFQASDPQIIERMLEQKKEIAKSLIPQLQAIQSEQVSEQAQILKGKQALKTIFEQRLNYKENLVIASYGQFEETLGSYFYQFHKRKQQKNINTRLLINEQMKGTGFVKSLYAQVRFLPRKYEFKTATFIYGDNVAMCSWSDDPTSFVITSEAIASTYRNYFELLWDVAK